MTRPLVRTLLVAASLAFPAAPAIAQEADSVPTYNLDSLVVSVIGTPIRFGQSPYPISVVGRTELTTGRTGMFLDDALQSLPGVQVQNRFNYAVGERVTIRGFGSRAQFGVRGINVVVDGIPATLADGQSTLDHLDLGSLGRVEALRGPASAVYGNASGGVLRFESEMPASVPLRQELTAVGGSDGMRRLQSKTSGTAGETGYLVSLDRLDYDGFRRFITNPDSGQSYGGASRTHVNARAERGLGGGEFGITLNYLDLDAESAGSLSRGRFNADPNEIHPFYHRDQTGKEVQQGQLGLTWAGPLSGFDANAAVYGLTRDFQNPIPNEFIDTDRFASGVRVTLGRQIASETRLLVGGEYDLQNDDRREFFNVGGQPDTALINQNERVRSAGGFAQVTVSLQDRVNLVGAARYDHTSYEVEDLLIRPGINPDNSGGRDMNNLSGSLGVHVSVMPDLSLFANFSTSFETPTTVELGNQETVSGGFNPNLDPTTGRTFEAGVRGGWADRLSFEATAFLVKLENEIIAAQKVGEADYYRNVPRTERKGAEVAVRARLLQQLSGQVTYTKVDATYEEAVDRYLVDVSGKKVPGLAPQQLQASLRATQGAWYLDFSAEYVDEIPVNDRNCLVVLATDRSCPLSATGTRQDGFTRAYTLLGARIGGNAIPLGGIEISPFAGVQNIADKRYMASVVPNAFAPVANHTNVRFYEPGPGRTFYVGASLAVSR